ncbi:type I-C CRISPR-associated protein Cas8c/Csd1 [Paenibacillus sp. 1011MAR3C5]|uniref:type I-C CRISPR-associated protein Cas8c/Csd1 n=1 Tax=Paenibacillus sp. 1011MAR3C5 TaxID=1675787 RepID=UPI000E6C6A84|nr:type I-C CRISPR-associated protein Cas8c/Csd1 [Paenibacillus sp. 1011MAR3C5]RJE85189.1 type I-C CRISPR-associated protein Cas8c/Csd1 [Paenibacillus sp. 1011MAR3C5]
MSWLLHLYDTYNANSGQVGVIKTRYNDQEFTLLPLSHTTQNAHIEVTVTKEGDIHSAEVIMVKSQMSTLIPCTEKSASRAGAVVAPYPLHDKLSYVAGDLIAYGGEQKKEDPFAAYIKQLKGWAQSPYATDKVKSIYSYVSKGTLVRDLIQRQILHADEQNRLIQKWDKGSDSARPPIYSVLAGDLSSAFVRFNVYAPGEYLDDVWKDSGMYESFIRYYNEQLGGDDYCYVKGELLPATDKHANKIRNAADKAKLISANDDTGFTYRGRFRSSQEAASISYEVSQKAHNALKWLINLQGKVIDQRVFLVWGSKRPEMPSFADDAFDLAPAAAVVKEAAFTYQEFARELAKAMDGYCHKLDGHTDAHIMVLDSATTGRMAVLYYRSMDIKLYLNKLIEWHTACAWLHRYRKDESGKGILFYGAPATRDIARAAYGPNAGDKVVKGLMERMLPCIIDGRPIPLDIVRSSVQRASNPVSMERWEWEKTLSIACALINKKEGRSVALDTVTTDHNYLFGRMLAIADVLERRALGDEDRPTNAIRYMNAFSRHPAKTWAIIQEALCPYQMKLGRKATNLNKLLDEVGYMMPPEKFTNESLTGLYLLGFYSQRYDLYNNMGKNKNQESAEADSEQ